MPSFDLNQARLHVELLTGDADTVMHWQTFNDDSGNDKLKQPKHFSASVNDCEEFFNYVQSNNYGVFLTVNKTDGKGREEENIIGYRAVFADVDGAELPDSPLKPTAITQRDSLHSHMYYRVTGVVTADQWKRLQKRIQLFFKSDRSVVDSCRVMRVCGTWNMKNPTEPAQYVVTEHNDVVYTPDEIEATFPLSVEQLTELDQWCNNRNSLDTGEGFNDRGIYRQRLVKWLQRAEVAVEGHEGNRTLLRVAGMGYDLGVNLEEAQALMWEYYNPRCQPPWEIHQRREFDRTVHNAYKYANNTAGCRTTEAEFKAGEDAGERPEIKEPPCGWEENAKLATAKEPAVTPVTVRQTENAEDNLSAIQAATLRAEITGKSSVWDLARCFVANKFVPRGLIRCDKVFYGFNGKCWDIIDDDDIKSRIAWYYQEFTFAPSKIKNIRDSVEDYIYQSQLHNNQWLKGDNENSDHTFVFNNGIKILNDGTNELLAHTPNYFTLNYVDYDYDDKGQCDEWLKFLSTLWEDEKMIDRLQEWFGYMLTSGNLYQKFASFVGKPRSGKGTITTIASLLVGNHNTCSPQLPVLDTDSNIINMSTSSLIIVPEAKTVHAARKDNVLSTLKAITGNDPIDAHRLYKGAMTCENFGNIILVSNDMPDFVDNSGALAARMVCFPFTKSFVGREDMGLLGRLKKELAGILNWSLEGLKRLESNKGVFTSAHDADEMLDDVRRDMFPLADFIEEFCIIGGEEKISSVDLFSGYIYWCGLKDSPNFKQKTFTSHLKASYLPVHGCRVTIDGKTLRGFKGITLNQRGMNGVKPSNTGNVAQFKPVPPAPTNVKEVN